MGEETSQAGSVLVDGIVNDRADGCYETRAFLRGSRDRMRLESFLTDHGRLRVGPEEMVFCERASRVVDGRGAELREW